MRILIAEKHDLFRQGLTTILQECFARPLISNEADSFAEMKALMNNQRFDLIIAGSNILKDLRPNLLRNIWYGQARTPVLAVTERNDVNFLENIKKFRLNGVISKSASSSDYKHAFQTLLKGEDLPLPGHQNRTDQANIWKDNTNIALTKRQNEVLALMSRGQSNRDIAENLSLSEGTVKVHVTAIFKTLGVRNRTQAMLLAQKK